MRYPILFTLLAAFSLSTFAHADASYDSPQEYGSYEEDDYGGGEQYREPDYRQPYNECYEGRCVQPPRHCMPNCQPPPRPYYPSQQPGLYPGNGNILECRAFLSNGFWVIRQLGGQVLARGRTTQELRNAEMFLLYQTRQCTQITHVGR